MLDREAFLDEVVAAEEEFSAPLNRRVAQDRRLAGAALTAAWATLAIAEQQALLLAMSDRLQAIGTLPRRSRSVLMASALSMARMARSSSRRAFRLSIDPQVPVAVLQRIRQLLATAPQAWAAQYRERAARFRLDAEQLVSDGLRRGRSDAAISRALRARWEGLSNPRPLGRITAASLLARARSDSLLASYADAGVQYYVIQSVRDERTCDRCWMLDGTRVRVADGQRIAERLAAASTPAALDDAGPFVRRGRDAAGRAMFYVPTPTGRQVLATLDESYVGGKGDAARFPGRVSAETLVGAGVGMPPFHPICRCFPKPETIFG